MIISHKYEVLAEIGRGGMGIVYKVQHVTLKTITAVKVLPAHLAADPELVGRFHREARVMAQLHHPNIVRVTDVDKFVDLHYFVMEYVEGRSLGDIVSKDGPRPIADVLAFAVQVARALAYAHGQSPAVIHRDVKPSNILIEKGTDRAVVTDFGLAKLAGGAESLRTETGKFIGTLRYCAPEQLVGAAQVDERVDVYALGMVIYEMLVGRSAYVDLERPQVIAGLLQMTVEHPFQFPGGTPEALRTLVVRATAKDRDRRHPSVAALLRDLEAMGGGSAASADTTVGRTSVPASAAGARPGARRTAIGVAAAVALAAGGALIFRVGAVWNAGAQRPTSAGPLDAPSATPGANGALATPDTRRNFSVMDFAPTTPDTRFAWMRDAIRANLNSRLSSAPDCKVFSKEFIDFKAQQMVRDGTYQDVRAATMEVAEKLGVTKAVLGSFRADGATLEIEAHVVNMETGVQEASETVAGPQSSFADLQASLAQKLMARLGVTPPAESAPVRAAESSSKLKSYRLLLEAEGQDAAPDPVPSGTPGRDRHSRVEPGALRALLAEAVRLRTASAAETDEVGGNPEEEIRATLEKYRQACERKDLTMLTEVYEHLSPAQIEANRRYFQNAGGLVVSFEHIDVAVGRNEAAVSYTRKDHFIDGETRKPTNVEVRLTKMLVRVDGSWKIVSGPVKR